MGGRRISEVSDRSNLQDLIYDFNIEKQYSKRFTRPDFNDRHKWVIICYGGEGRMSVVCCKT